MELKYRDKASSKWRIRRLALALPIFVAVAVPVSLAGMNSASGSGAPSLLGKIKSTHTLSIAMSAFAPEDFQTAKGAWTGYDVDILRGYAKSIGAKLQINSIPFASSIEAVSTERDDISVDIFITAQRAQVIDFSRPMLNYSDTVDVNSTAPAVKAATVSGLAGKNIGITTGTSELLEAQKVPHATITQYDTIQNTLLALSQGRVDAALEPGVDVAWSAHENPSLHVKVLGSVPKSIAPSIKLLRGYYGVPKNANAKSFLVSLNKYLKKIACNGQEQSIFNKYGMKQPLYLSGICAAPNSTSI